MTAPKHRISTTNFHVHKPGYPSTYNDTWLKKIGGCERCPWKATPSCQYGVGIKVLPDGTLLKRHANGICGERNEFVSLAMDRKGYLKGVQSVMALDTVKIANEMLIKAENNEAQWRDAIEWKKLAASELAGIVKQEEGTKVTIRNQIDDLRSVITDENVIDAEFSETESEEESDEDAGVAQ